MAPVSILTAPLAGAGPAFLTSDYLAQSNPTALSVCLTLSSSLEITGMLPERTGPARGSGLAPRLSSTKQIAAWGYFKHARTPSGP